MRCWSTMASGRCWSACCPSARRSGPVGRGSQTAPRSTAIVFVLVTGVPWRMVPREIGCSGVTAWRRLLRDWQAAGVWERLHRELLRRLNAAGKLDWSRGIVDSSQIRALRGGSDRALAG